MITAKAKKKIEALTSELNEHNYRYYILSAPTISDYEFDMKLKELEKLEKEFPEFATEGSPTKRVGGEITKEFKQVVHQYPMMSLGNTYSRQELADFDTRVSARIIGRKIVMVNMIDILNLRSRGKVTQELAVCSLQECLCEPICEMFKYPVQKRLNGEAWLVKDKTNNSVSHLIY